MNDIEELYDIYKGNKHKTAWIIGKGPSLNYLKKEHIGEGIVIAINSSIIKVEQLGLDNTIFSIQKDGSSPLYRNCCPDKKCHNCTFDMVYPKKSILLIHKHESIDCMADYSPRYVFDNEKLGLAWDRFSALTSIKIAQRMGYTKICFISFDACINGSNKSIVPGTDLVYENNNYIIQAHQMISYLIGVDHTFITPEE